MKRVLAENMHAWLLGPVSIDEAEALHMYDGIPFGHEQRKWLELRSILLPDSKSELWSFRSPPETWTTFPLRGMEGYAVVREGKIVDFVLTAVS